MVGRWLVLGVAVAGVLAGCTGDAGTGSKVKLGSGTTVTLQEVTNQIGTGGISGVVVDDAIRPVANAPIRLGGGLNQTSNTTADGLFTFPDLEPGLYVLRVDAFSDKATSKRYLPVQTTAEVVAGETAKVRVVVLADKSPIPYHQTLKFDGFYQASSGFADEVLDLAVWNHTYEGQTLPNGCTCRFSFVTDGPFVTGMLELQYDESSPTADGWTFSVKNGGPDASTLYFCNEGEQTTDPCIYRINASADGKTYPASNVNYTLGVWTDPTWVYVQEKFTVYLTLFYLEPAPAGWAFTKGDQ